MLQYNFQRVLRAKGIVRPFTFLRNAGFSDNFATKIKSNRIKRLDLGLMERLCLSLGCTPNDFIEWTPDADQQIAADHPIQAIRKTDKILDMTKTLNTVPLSKIAEIEILINEYLKK